MPAAGMAIADLEALGSVECPTWRALYRERLSPPPTVDSDLNAAVLFKCKTDACAFPLPRRAEQAGKLQLRGNMSPVTGGNRPFEQLRDRFAAVSVGDCP